MSEGYRRVFDQGQGSRIGQGQYQGPLNSTLRNYPRERGMQSRSTLKPDPDSVPALPLQVKAECQQKMYSGPACVLHGPGEAKRALWNITASLEGLRRNPRPWVDIY
jgi:hypothetical protein